MRENYQALIDEASALFGTPATLESRDFGLIAFGAHDSEDDRVMDPVRTRSILHRRSTAVVRQWFESFGITRAQGPLRIPPEPEAGVLTGRICVPARHKGVAYGYIWLLDDGALTLDDPRLADALGIAARVGSLLAGESRADARLGASLRSLLDPGSVNRDSAAGELTAALGPAVNGPLAMVAVTPWRAESERAVPTLAGVPSAVAACVLAPDGGPATNLAALVRLRTPDHPGPALATAERLLRTAPEPERSSGSGPQTGPSPTGGISGPVTGLGNLRDGWRQARAAARAAGAESRWGAVAQWGELGPYRLLTALPPGPPDPAVAPLLQPRHAALARTAETYLDHAGQAGRTAAVLGIHRQTLYYRLSRVERLTGLSLDDGEHRLLLHMVLKTDRFPGR